MNEKWFSLDIPEIEKKLKTNAARGLSPKAARSRYRKESSEFFLKSPKKPTALLLELISDFSLILLIILSVIALCFGDYTTGATLIAIIALNLGAAFCVTFKLQKTFEAFWGFFRPSVTVIRAGKAYLIDAEHVVPGDVVLVGEGDILPFDARLVTSDALKVEVRIDRKTQHSCDKLAEGVVKSDENNIVNMVNMIHAGSRIISGNARAIVTAIGRYTYYGAMTGGMRLSIKGGLPKGLSLLKKYCRAFCLVITILLLPFSILSLIFSHGNVTLMTSFTGMVAVAASSLTQFTYTVYKFFFERQARRCIKDSSPAVFKNADMMDKLASTDYVFLLDGSAVSDGSLHFYKALSVDGELSYSEISGSSVKALSEAVCLYATAQSGALSVGVRAPERYSLGFGEFMSKLGVDAEALKIRCNILGFVQGNSKDKTDQLFYTDRGEKSVLNVGETESAIERCAYACRGERISAVTDEAIKMLVSNYRKYTKMGMRVLVFTRSESEFSQNDVFVGMLVFSEMLDTGFSKAVSDIAAFGVKTISFVSSDRSTTGERRELPAPIIGKAASMSDFVVARQPISFNFGEIDTYKDFSLENIDKLISYVHSLNKKVAIVCFADTYKRFAEKPDIFITCSSVKCRFSGRFEDEIETLEVAGEAQSLSCRQDVKAEADIIVPRPDGKGGGLASLVFAIGYCRTAYMNLAGFFRYAVCAQFIRIVLVLLPMFFGESFLDARHVLFCGFIVDFAVMLAFATDSREEKNIGKTHLLFREFANPITNNAGIIIAVSVSALVAIILPAIIGFFDFFGRYFYQTEYRFITMIILQLSVMYCLRYGKKKKLRKRGIKKGDVVLVSSLLVFIALSFALPFIGALLDIRTISLLYLALIAVPIAIFVILYFTIGNLKLHK